MSERDYTICDGCHKAICACDEQHPLCEIDVSEFGVSIPYTMLEDDHYGVWRNAVDQLMNYKRELIDLECAHTLYGGCPNGEAGCAYCKPTPRISTAYDPDNGWGEDENSICCCACHDEDDD